MKESFRGLNSASALMRFKMHAGVNRTQHVNISGYVAMMAIKRILNTEFTDEIFTEFVKKHGFVKGSRVGNDKKYRINKFISSMDKWPDYVIKTIYSIYLTQGIKAMLDELVKPKYVLTRSMRAEA